MRKLLLTLSKLPSCKGFLPLATCVLSGAFVSLEDMPLRTHWKAVTEYKAFRDKSVQADPA